MDKTELDYNKSMKNKAKEYRPRVVVKGNTGTRIIKSKKDKQNSRQSLKLALKCAWWGTEHNHNIIMNNVQMISGEAYEFEMEDGALVMGYIHNNKLTIPGYFENRDIIRAEKDKYDCMWVQLGNKEWYIGLS